MTAAPTAPAGRHEVPSTDPPATAQELGLTAPAEVLTAPPPLFQGSRRRQAAAAAATASEPGSPVGEGSPSGGGLDDDATTPTDPPSSYPGSTDGDGLDDAGGGRGRARAGREWLASRDLPQLRDGIAQAFHALGDEANARVAPGSDLFLTDEADEQGLAEPASRLILRRLPDDLAAASNPDFADAIAAAVVLARYAVKQLNLARAMRRAAAAAAGQVPYGTPPAPYPDGEPAAGEPAAA
jgi:hypothetical protein